MIGIKLQMMREGMMILSVLSLSYSQYMQLEISTSHMEM